MPTELKALRVELRSTADLISVALATYNVDDESVFNEALVALQERGSREVLDEAIRLCHCADVVQRVLGARILGELRAPGQTLSGARAFPEECCDALLDLVTHETDPRVLEEGIFALGHLGNRRCEPQLIALRNHPSAGVRAGVAFALCGWTSPAAVQAQLKRMDDGHVAVRDWATTGIGGEVSLDSPEIRAALLRRADDQDEITRAEAMHGLARRHDRRVVSYLLRELSAAGDHINLFADAAQSYLDIDDHHDLDIDALVSMLRNCGSD